MTARLLDTQRHAAVEKICGLYRDGAGIWRDVVTGREVRVWQRFLSGRRLNLLDPTPFDFEDEDLALGLAREPRWNGQTRGDWPYSVAQHSLAVLDGVRRALPPSALTPAAELRALLHDAPEGLGLKDVITPLKAILGDAYRLVDRRLQEIVHARYGVPELPAWVEQTVKREDKAMAATEAYQLASYSLEEVRDPRVLGNAEKPRTDLALVPWPPAEAARRFLEALHELLARASSGR